MCQDYHLRLRIACSGFLRAKCVKGVHSMARIRMRAAPGTKNSRNNIIRLSALAPNIKHKKLTHSQCQKRAILYVYVHMYNRSHGDTW